MKFVRFCLCDSIIIATSKPEACDIRCPPATNPSLWHGEENQHEGNRETCQYIDDLFPWRQITCSAVNHWNAERPRFKMLCLLLNHKHGPGFDVNGDGMRSPWGDKNDYFSPHGTPTSFYAFLFLWKFMQFLCSLRSRYISISFISFSRAYSCPKVMASKRHNVYKYVNESMIKERKAKASWLTNKQILPRL